MTISTLATAVVALGAVPGMLTLGATGDSELRASVAGVSSTDLAGVVEGPGGYSGSDLSPWAVPYKTVVVPVRGTPAATVSTTPTALQLNICNSGEANCYRDYNVQNGVSTAVPAAVAAIRARKADQVTVNEACDSDLAPMVNAVAESAAQRGYTHVVGLYVPVLRPSGSDPTPVRLPCKGPNGAVRGGYGNLVILAARFAAAPNYEVLANRYPDTIQQAVNAAGDLGERRAWGCIVANGYPSIACVTHLTHSPPAGVTDRRQAQCRFFMSTMSHLANTSGNPLIAAGDFNLRAESSVLQGCRPAGFTRKGDGSLQHFFYNDARLTAIGSQVVTSLLPPGSSHPASDHPALSLRLQRN